MPTLESTSSAAEARKVSPSRLRREQERRSEAFLLVAKLQARADENGAEGDVKAISAVETQRKIIRSTTRAIDAHYRGVTEDLGRERPYDEDTRDHWEGRKGAAPRGSVRFWRGEDGRQPIEYRRAA